MDSRIALITGAASGIGRATCDALLARGWKVIATGLNQGPLDRMAADASGQLHGLSFPVQDIDAVQQSVDDLPANWTNIDLLVNAAGHDVGGRKRFDEGTAEDWQAIIETNVTGTMNVCHAVIPGMLVRGQGHVINLGSIAGFATYAGGTAYNASKFAVRGFTEALAKDYADTPIRVTEILPGMTKSGFATARHKGDVKTADAFYDSFEQILLPEDVAGAILWALDQPPHVTVSQIVIRPTVE